MKFTKNLLFMAAAWTGLVLSFVAMFVSVALIEPSGIGMPVEIVTFSRLASMIVASESQYFPLSLIQVFVVVAIVANAGALAVMVLRELSIIKLPRLAYIIISATVASIGLLVLIFCIIFVAVINANMSSMGVFSIGLAPFVVLIASSLCGGALIARELWGENN